MSGIAANCVMSDNASGIGMAFHHLHGHGHRRIAYIGDSERVFPGRERAAAFRAALRSHGQPAEGLVHPGELTPERVAAALDVALHGAEPATALVTGNMETTMQSSCGCWAARRPPGWRSSASTRSRSPTCCSPR
jgi:LacI family transcriptional regulator